MKKSTIGAVLISSVLFPLALPNEIFPIGNPFLGLIALIPLYLAYLWCRSPRQASLVGAIFGGISTFLANYWLVYFGDYSIWTIGGTTLGYVGFNAILGVFLWRTLQAPRPYRPVLFAMVWTVYELLKSIGFLGYPWGLAAYPFNMVTVLIQVVDITGVWGLTFIVVYLNAAAAQLIEESFLAGRRWATGVRNLAVAGVLITGTLIYGIVALGRTFPISDNLDVLLVQQNADSWNTRDIAGPILTAQQLSTRGLDESPRSPDIVVWSETSLRYPYNEFRRWYEENPAAQPFVEFLAGLPAPLLTGSPYRTDGGEFTIHNAALLLDADGQIRQWYGKQQLVPFAEFVPFWESPLVQRFFREVVGIAAIWAPGPGYRLFEIETGNNRTVLAATPICFEDGFAYVTRRFVRSGAQIFINLTNNSWSLTNSAQYQHLVAARFRAVETRRSLIRSTNSGFTGVVDPWGRVTHAVPMFTEQALFASVPVHEPTNESIYVRWGEYLPIVMLGMLLGLLGYARFAPRRREWAPGDPLLNGKG